MTKQNDFGLRNLFYKAGIKHIVYLVIGTNVSSWQWIIKPSISLTYFST